MQFIAKKSVSSLSYFWLMKYYFLQMILFVILTNAKAQNNCSISITHLYSFHSFNDFSTRRVIGVSNKKIKSQKKIDQNKVPNALFNFGLEKKYVEGFKKLLFSPQIDSLVERIDIETDMVGLLDKSGPVYPIGTFLIIVENKQRDIIAQMKVESIEKLTSLLHLYENQFTTMQDKEFVSKKIIPWLLSGYEIDLEIENQK